MRTISTDGLKPLGPHLLIGSYTPEEAECETAQFRTSRAPFGHRDGPFESAEPRAGRQTVEADCIPEETEALFRHGLRAFSHRLKCRGSEQGPGCLFVWIPLVFALGA